MITIVTKWTYAIFIGQWWYRTRFCGLMRPRFVAKIQSIICHTNLNLSHALITPSLQWSMMLFISSYRASHQNWRLKTQGHITRKAAPVCKKKKNAWEKVNLSAGQWSLVVGQSNTAVTQKQEGECSTMTESKSRCKPLKELAAVFKI